MRNIAKSLGDDGVATYTLTITIGKLMASRDFATQREAEKAFGQPMARPATAISPLRALESLHERNMVRLAMETGARQRELELAQWDEFNLEAGWWLIPGDHAKSGRCRIIPLSAAAIAILNEMSAVAGPPSPRVFNALDRGLHPGATARHLRELEIPARNFLDLRRLAKVQMKTGLAKDFSAADIGRILDSSMV